MRTEPFPALPQGYSRRDVIALMADVGRDIGLSPRLTDILTRLIGSTDQEAWVDPLKEPIFYGRQETFAQRLRISTRQLRTHERTLQKHGLLQRRTLANGSRYGSAGLGLVLTPLIERFTEFLDLREARKAQFERMKQLKASRSVRLATFRDELARLSASDQLSVDVQDLIAERNAWPRTDTLLTLGEARLFQHLEEATDLCTRLVNWIENHSDSSCEPEETFRSYIQEDIHQTLHESCNDTVDKQGVGKPTHSDLTRSVPDGPDDCREKLQRKRASGGDRSTSRAILGILRIVACGLLGK